MVDKKMLNFLYREAVYDKYGHKCAFCGKEASDIHHFRSRQLYPKLKYCIKNGVPVCRGCHQAIHNESAEFEAEEILIKKRGDEWLRRLQEREKEIDVLDDLFLKKTVKKLSEKLSD